MFVLDGKPIQYGFLTKKVRAMPKLKNRPPKYCELNGQAVVYLNGRPKYLGRHGSPESWEAYHRFCAEKRANPIFSPPKEENSVTVGELAAAFLDHAERMFNSADYSL